MTQVTSEEAFSLIQPLGRMQLIQHLDDRLDAAKPGRTTIPLKLWSDAWVLLEAATCVSLCRNTKLIQEFLLECANWSPTITFCVPLTSQFITEASAQVIQSCGSRVTSSANYVFVGTEFG